jgi:drug/metabolite transporter (DMT)-like permease
MPDKRNPPAWRADLALAFIAFIWGATFVVVKQALADVSTLLFLALRFSLAALALGVVFRRRSFQRGLALRGGLFAGAFLFAGYFFQTFGLRFTSASKSAFITGLSIVIVPILSAAVYQKVPHPSEVLGVGVATIGMGLLTLRSFHMDFGDLLTLACALAFAVHIVIISHYSPIVGFESFTFIQISTAAALGLSSCWWAETPRVQWSGGVLIALLVTGLLATALAFGVQVWAQRYTTATRTALIFSLEPVFAWITSFLLAGEVLSTRATAGAFLILAGILLVELKPVGVRPHPSG